MSPIDDQKLDTTMSKPVNVQNIFWSVLHETSNSRVFYNPHEKDCVGGKIWMFDTMLDLGRLRITILCKETIPTVSSFFLITFKGNLGGNGNVDKMKP